VFGLSRGGLQPGWVACAPAGATSAFALVQPGADGRPAVRWTASAPWGLPVAALQRLRRQHGLHRHRCVALLQRHQYQCVTMDAPPDVDRADWASALRWQLKDTVDFPVDSAAIDVMAVPEGTSYRAQAQVIAVAAAATQVRPLVECAVDAGTPWQAIDITETALRNLSALVEPDGSAQALLHCQRGHATLVVTHGGELLATRQMELNLLLDDDADPDVRSAGHEQAGLELQRSLDGVERAFGQVTLSRLLITPMPGVHALCDHLAPLLYVPVAMLDLRDALDWSAVPGLLDDPALLNQHLCAIGAALREQ
jgi:MSHA biogenesis protein MshI